jgi:sugar lactone lactonase YvrE
MMAACASWCLGLALLLQAGDGSGGAKPAPAPAYPWEIVPGDALWGHLSEGNFREPVGLCFEPVARELYVADSKNARIGVFDAEGTPVFTFGGAAVLQEPQAVFADREGTLFVVDGDRTRLSRFNYRGEAEPPIEFKVALTAQALATPISIAAAARDLEGRWWVADRATNRIWLFEVQGGQGKALRELPPPIGKSSFQSISDIAVSSEGLLAVSDQRGEPVIHVYDPQGTMLHAFGKKDIGLDNFTAAIALTFDERGFLYAVDLLRHDVKVFTPAGKMVARFGGWFSPETRGRAPGELLYPADIAIDPEGAIWVAERFGHRVQMFARRPLTQRPGKSGVGPPGR